MMVFYVIKEEFSIFIRIFHICDYFPIYCLAKKAEITIFSTEQSSKKKNPSDYTSFCRCFGNALFFFL